MDHPATVTWPQMTSSTESKKTSKTANYCKSSSYAIFFREMQTFLRQQCPTATFGEMSKMIARKWEHLNDAAKKEYRDKSSRSRKEKMKHMALKRIEQLCDRPGPSSTVSQGITRECSSTRTYTPTNNVNNVGPAGYFSEFQVNNLHSSSVYSNYAPFTEQQLCRPTESTPYNGSYSENYAFSQHPQPQQQWIQEHPMQQHQFPLFAEY